MSYEIRSDPADSSKYLYMTKSANASAADFKNGFQTYLATDTTKSLKPHHVRFSFASGDIHKEDTNLRLMLIGDGNVKFHKFYFNCNRALMIKQ